MNYSQNHWLHWVFSMTSAALVALVSTAMLREAHRPIHIEQRIVSDLAIIDRCETCHDAAAHSEPWLTQHPVERFACTPCHGGQGLATTALAAHRVTPDWQRPLFTRLEQQAACGTCHRESEVQGAPLLNAGRKALASRACGPTPTGCAPSHPCQAFACRSKRPKISLPLLQSSGSPIAAYHPGPAAKHR